MHEKYTVVTLTNIINCVFHNYLYKITTKKKFQTINNNEIKNKGIIKNYKSFTNYIFINVAYTVYILLNILNKIVIHKPKVNI